MISTLLGLAGFALLILGASLFALWAGVVVAGVVLVYIAYVNASGPGGQS